LSVAVKLCTGSLQTVADKLRYAKLTAGIHQDTLAAHVGIDRATLLRYENGQVSEENMEIEWLIKIALICGMDKYFCCSSYHMFILNDPSQQIKQYRKINKLTQKQLAAILGVALNTVKRWEQKKNKPPIHVWELVAESIQFDL
jgi:DNA-binding XRE family transcriptional regulator